MRSLIVEDEFTSRMQLKYFLEEYGNCDVAVNGAEAVAAYKISLEAKKPYNLICLDINLPDKSGQQVLNELRAMEEAIGVTLNSEKSVKIFMTTAMSDAKTIAEAFYGLCDEYLTKPIEREKLVKKLILHKLIS